MSNIKEKISASIDKLTHRHGNTNTETGSTPTSTSSYNQGSMGSAGTGAGMGGNTTSYNTTSGTGMGAGTGTGAGYDTTTGTGMTGTGAGMTGTGMGAGTTTGAYDTTGATGTGTISASEIIDSKTFTKTEDHEVLIEKKKYELEHRPVEKQYVVETRFVGEKRVPGAPVEIVGKETREVDERVVQAPRGDRTVIVQDVDVPASEVREMTREVTGGYNTTGTTGEFGGAGTGMTGTTGGMGTTGMGGNKYDSTTGPSATGREI